MVAPPNPLLGKVATDLGDGFCASHFPSLFQKLRCHWGGCRFLPLGLKNFCRKNFCGRQSMATDRKTPWSQAAPHRPARKHFPNEAKSLKTPRALHFAVVKHCLVRWRCFLACAGEVGLKVSLGAFFSWRWPKPTLAFDTQKKGKPKRHRLDKREDTQINSNYPERYARTEPQIRSKC